MRITDFEDRLREDGSNGLTVNLCVDLYLALKDLWEISGEATIPLTDSKAVRRMAALVRARMQAEKIINRAELKNI